MNTDNTSSPKLQFKQLHSTFVAEVEGVDWTKPISDDVISQIQDGIDKYGVLIFRKANIDNATHVAFTNRFGDLDSRPLIRSKDRFPGQPHIFDISNLTADGEIITEADPIMFLFNRGNGLWHTDMTYHPRRDKYSILRAIEIPPTGGETQFADSRTIYESLSPEWKDKLKDMIVNCSLLHNRRQAAPELYKGEDPLKWSISRYKAVYPHPGSGRDNLYLTSYAYKIDGLSIEETARITKELLEYGSQPQFTFKAQWKQPGDMIMWDNTAVWHRALDDSMYRGKYRRDMRRTNTYDSGPYAWGENEPGNFWHVQLPKDPLAHSKTNVEHESIPTMNEVKTEA